MQIGFICRPPCREIETVLPEIETDLPEIETTLSEIEILSYKLIFS